MEKCRELNFIYKIKYKQKYIIFTLNYYVPFFDNLQSVIDKAINQTGLTENDNKISVEVKISKCDLTHCIAAVSKIDKLANYISSIDFNCSSCSDFNRGWICCGQFAPFMYIYSFLLLEDNYDKYINKYGRPTPFRIEDVDPMVYNIANVFYKIFSGYASDDPTYKKHRTDVKKIYDLEIPDVYENLKYWKMESFEFENNKSYLVLLCDDDGPSHFFYIYRCDDYIIICDSWSEHYIDRMPITRIVEYTEFSKYIKRINNLYNLLTRDKVSDKENLLLFYNFIIDSLFLVPYDEEDIADGKQSFYIENLSYVAVIDPNKIVEVLDTLGEKSGFFETYLKFGGNKKKKSIKKRKLHLCTFKTPTCRRFMSAKVGSLCAFQMRKGVNKKNTKKKIMRI
jgi:hypothetical protein